MDRSSPSCFDDSSAAQPQFLSLFLRNEREIFRYVAALVPNLEDVDDIVQQTAISLSEKSEANDSARPVAPSPCRFALNKARQWIGRRQRWQALLANGLAEDLEQRRAQLQPQGETLLRRLAQLPDQQRYLVEGYYFRRGRVDNLAADTGRSVGATYKMLQRIRHLLSALTALHEGQSI